ncbi:MAG: hypothetical protein HY720_25155 [Planctomycetes bacterium]|nr:hypothetical protein [Planctomycetota bacterium]
MNLKKVFGGVTVTVEAAGCSEQNLVDLLTGIEDAKIRDGGVFRYGPLLLRFRAAPDGALAVVSPEYREDAMAGAVTDLGPALRACAAQTTLAVVTEAEEDVAPFDYWVTIYAGPMAGATFFRVLRNGPRDDETRHTGWLVVCGRTPDNFRRACGEADDDAAFDEGKCRLILTGSLLRTRPALLRVMSLPAGWSGVCHGDCLERLWNPDGEEVLQGRAI